MSAQMTCHLCSGLTGGCTGRCQWRPQTHEQYRGVAELPAKGCICPPTAEKTCQRWDCGRKSHPNVTIGGGVVGTLADAHSKKDPLP